MTQQLSFLNYNEMLRHEHTLTSHFFGVSANFGKVRPLPTIQHGARLFANFATPAPDLARSLPPDRWWLLGAHNAQLVLYARTWAQPFTKRSNFLKSISIQAPPRATPHVP